MLKAGSVWFGGVNSLRAGSLGEGPVVWTREKAQHPGRGRFTLSGSTSPCAKSSPVCATIVDWSVASSSALRHGATFAFARAPGLLSVACHRLLPGDLHVHRAGAHRGLV